MRINKHFIKNKIIPLNLLKIIENLRRETRIIVRFEWVRSIKIYKMKKILGILFVAFSLTACDDGEITLQSFDFDDQEIQKCPTSNLFFKTKNSELLLVSLPEGAIDNEPTPAGEPRIVPIQGDNKVIYRKYSSVFSGNTMVCSLITPSTPVVVREWQATGGTIEIITTPRLNTNNEVIGYTHNITFVTINFASEEDSFSFVRYIFGNFQTNI